MDPLYLALIATSLVLGVATQWYIQGTYRKWSRVDASFDGTGADVARRMLDENGAVRVGIVGVGGTLTDHYDPRDGNLHLSDENLRGGSVSSVAVACHEAGHAIQDSRGFALLRLRTALVPAVNFAQRSWMIVFLVGVLLNMSGFVTAAIALFSISVLFHVVTLPVEIDASHRAIAFLRGSGSSVDVRGARAVLIAAALTYVSAALVSILQLLYISRRR